MKIQSSYHFSGKMNKIKRSEIFSLKDVFECSEIRILFESINTRYGNFNTLYGNFNTRYGNLN